MKCPSCDCTLIEKSLQDVKVDECSQCKSIWFEDGELREVKDITEPDTNWMDFEIWKHEDRFQSEPRNLACPKCSQNMVAVDYDDTSVVINYCPQCKGTWLEQGEFKQIIEALNNEMANKSLSDYVKAGIEEAVEIVAGPESFISEWKDFSTFFRMLQYRILVEKPRLHDTLINIQKANPIK
jgi:Zn-finger nucleic acid-binding protein